MQKPTKNILFSYLYRDAANYKLSGQVVFQNPDRLILPIIDEKIKIHLEDGEFFIPELLGLKKPVFEEHDPEIDHEWCEYCGIEYTDEESNTEISFESFLKKIELVEMKHDN